MEQLLRFKVPQRMENVQQCHRITITNNNHDTDKKIRIFKSLRHSGWAKLMIRWVKPVEPDLGENKTFC